MTQRGSTDDYNKPRSCVDTFELWHLR